MLTQKDVFKNQDARIRTDDPVSNPMPWTKIQAFLEEFPWIRRHVNGPIAKVYVSGVEQTILTYRLQAIDEGIYTHNVERIVLLDETGAEVKRKSVTLKKKYYFFGPLVSVKKKEIRGVVTCRPGEMGRLSTVSQVVGQLGVRSDRIRFLLSYWDETETVIIYKVPKRATLREWIENEVESERSELKNEVAAIS